MITLKPTMDPRSLDIERDGKHIGYLQWHKERSPRIVLVKEFSYLSILELENILEAYKEQRARLG